MLSIEEYIARRKKEDKLNEFDIDARAQNVNQQIIVPTYCNFTAN